MVLGLFGGGLINAIRASLGGSSGVGDGPSLDAYRQVLFDPAFVDSLLWTLYLAGTATLLSVVLGVAAALWFNRAGARSGWLLCQVPLTVPHLVAAAGIVMLISQSGLIARLAAAAGWIDAPADFPALVNDRLGVGILLTYLWKETPFIALIAMAALRHHSAELEQAARTLGASPWQCLRHVTLPRIAPAVTVAAVFVFAFTFGAFEIPLLLGPTAPETLPVAAWHAYRSIELTQRPVAMAIAMIITALSAALCLLYFRLGRRIG